MKKVGRVAIIIFAAIAAAIGLVVAGIVMLVSVPIQFVHVLFRGRPKPVRPVPIEEQFSTLATCGIEIDRSLLMQVPIQHNYALKVDYLQHLEQQPYAALLRGAGSAVKDPETEHDRAPSPRLFTFGPDWIDEPESYCHLLSSCAAVVDERIENLSVRTRCQGQDEVAILTFRHAGCRHKWQLSCDSQWIDEQFFDLIPTLKLGKAGKSLYWVGEVGDGCVIGLTAAEAEQLRNATGLPLQPWA